MTPMTAASQTSVDIDLDTLAAARREGRGFGPTTRLHDVSFNLPVELPVDVVYSMLGKSVDELDPLGVVATAESLFGALWQDFRLLQPTLDDLRALLREALPKYAVTPGESAGSSEPSSAGTS